MGQIVMHRGVVDAALLGQHPADVFAIDLPQRITRRLGDRLVLGEELEHQRRAILGRRDLADSAAHQTVHARHRRDHRELFPHIEHDVVAAGRVDLAAGELGRDRPHPLADPTGAVAESDPRKPIVVPDAAVGLQAGADIGDAAEDRLAAKHRSQPVEMDEPVQAAAALRYAARRPGAPPRSPGRGRTAWRSAGSDRRDRRDDRRSRVAA